MYDAQLRTALIKFKYYAAMDLAGFFSELLEEAFTRHFDPAEFDVMLPMPMHPRRLFVRGFNQVTVMAERLSQKTGVPLDRVSLEKVKDTPPQVGLTRAARRKNLQGAFGIAPGRSIEGRRILIVDDVFTTGSSIEEASRTVMRARAKSVSVLVLALRAGSHVTLQ